MLRWQPLLERRDAHTAVQVTLELPLTDLLKLFTFPIHELTFEVCYKWQPWEADVSSPEIILSFRFDVLKIAITVVVACS